jgi:uncharacterized protein DUF3892
VSVRIIDYARQDDFGNISAIGNSGQDWSPVERREAVSHIESGEHSYVVLADGHAVTIGVLNGRWLRTAPNDQEADNLDTIVWSPAGAAGLTGSFDLMITIGEDALRRVVAGLHATAIIEHNHLLVAGGHQIEIVMACPRIDTVPSGNGGAPSVAIHTRLHCTVSRLNDALDAGFAAVVDIVSRASMEIRTRAAGAVELRVKYATPVAGSVALVTPLAAAEQALLLPALTAWLTHARPDVWHMRLPGELSFVRHAGCRLVAPGVLQVGLAAEGARPPVYPSPEPGDWTIAVSRWQLASRVYDVLREQLGAVPPPAGDGDVLIDAARSVYLQRLSVSLDEGHVILTGLLQKRSTPTVSASFVARVTLGLTAGGLVRIDDVSIGVTVQEWYAALFDFLSGGSFTTALRRGIRDALAGDAGSGRVLLSADLLSDVAAFGLDHRPSLKPKVTRLAVRPSGLVLGGNLDVHATTGPVVDLRAVAGSGGETLLHACHSWARGRTLTDAHWAFGDGTELRTSGPGMKLAVAHRFAPGRYAPKLTLTDDRQTSASRSVSLTVH